MKALLQQMGDEVVTMMGNGWLWPCAIPPLFQQFLMSTICQYQRKGWLLIMTLCNSRQLSWLQLRRQNQKSFNNDEEEIKRIFKRNSKVSNALSHLSWHGLCQQLHNLDIASFSHWFQIPSISEFSYWFWIPSIFYLNFALFSYWFQI